MRRPSWLYVTFALATIVAVAFMSASGKAWPAGGRGAPQPLGVVLVPPDDNVAPRMDAKAAVTRRLLAGELTLPEAAASFRRIATEYPLRAGDPSTPGEETMSEAEHYCRQAIRWAAAQAAEESTASGEAASRRLHGELDALLRAGPIEWPDAP